MNDDSVLGQSLGQLGGVVKDAVKQAVKIPGQMAEGVEKQIVGEGGDKNADSQDKQAESVSEENSKKQTEEVVKSFYEKSEDGKLGNTKKSSLDKKAVEEDEFRKQIKDKSPEEQKKLLELRAQLHKQTYYDPTFNPAKKQEERPQEKEEREKEEKKQMEELQIEEKKKKELPVTVKEGTHEKVPGIAG